MKTIPVSVRLTHDEAEFLSNLTINGAKTPSEKLRAIIGEARKKRTRNIDFLGCFQMTLEQIAPVVEKIKKSELHTGTHSEVIARVAEWLPDMMACLVSKALGSSEELTHEELSDLEKEIAERVFRLIESFTQMAVTSRCPCYEPTLIRKRISPIVELMDLIKKNSQ